ncbi:MAG: SemiSWEET family transporter [Hydrogenothermaceae bacterium]|nr:SemiSWEET family transporter [Hydrogenothermaceae bacterium]
MIDSSILGLIAVTLTTTAYIPQTYKVLKERSAKDFSWLWLGFMFVGILLWFVYGVSIDNLPLIIANGISLLSLLLIMVAKYVYR